jgi:hypothetical protein
MVIGIFDGCDGRQMLHSLPLMPAELHLFYSMLTRLYSNPVPLALGGAASPESVYDYIPGGGHPRISKFLSELH